MLNKHKKKSKLALNRSVSMNEELTAVNSSFSHPINEENEDEDDNGEQKQVKRQMGIFEEFKIKYDELRKQNNEKRSEIDELKKLNKRQQIQILNINTEFYTKQITRLRGEVDRLQEDCEDFKFKYFESENKRKQLESSLGVNQKQSAKLIKLFETQKVHNAQLKHQLKENQKQYMNIIATVEESSNSSAKRYADCQKKLLHVEGELKKCKAQLDSERKNAQKLQKAKKQLQQQTLKQIQKLQIQLKTTKKQLDDSQDQAREYRKQIATLKQSLSQLTHEINKLKSLKEFETTKNLEKVAQFRSARVLEIQNKRFKEEVEGLKKELELKASSLRTLQIKFDEIKQQADIYKKQNDQKITDLQNKKAAIEKHYESKNLALNKQIELLKIKCIRTESQEQSKRHELNLSKLTQSQNNQRMFQRKLAESQKDESPLLAFQHTIEQALQSKDKQVSLLKTTLTSKIDQIYQLKQQLQDEHIVRESLKNQISILEKKLTVQEKNLSSKYDINFLEIKNQVDLLERKLTQTEAKVQAKSKQIKEKDAFIMESIIGRIQKQQDVPLVMAQMQRILEGAYIEKLADAENKIKSLESKLSPKKL